MSFEVLSGVVRSLRFRLMLWNAFAVFITGVAVLFSVREGMRQTLLRELDTILDQDAQEIALTLAAEGQVDWELVHTELDRKAESHDLRGWFVRFYDQQGDPDWSSVNTPDLSVLARPFPAPRTWTHGGYRLMVQRIPGQHQHARWMVVGSSQAFIARDMARIDRQGILVGLAVLIISPLGGYLLALRATRPLAQMIETTAGLRPTQLNERLRVRGTGDELDRLAITINGLLDRIGDYLQKNSDFLANSAHELRTPLAAIRSSIEVALNADRSQAEYAELLGDVIEECAALETLVNQLLLLAETDSDRLGSNLEPVPLDQLTGRAIDMFQAVAEVHELHLVGGDFPPTLVEGNRHHLRQLVNNLLDNAIKFTALRYATQPTKETNDSPAAASGNAGGGQITVDLERDDATGNAVLRVTDNGVGIPPEHLPHLFDRFYRVDRSRTRETVAGGTGLGLCICAAIVSAHQGTIEVKSEPGQGTTFIVTLPLGRSPPVGHAPARVVSDAAVP